MRVKKRSLDSLNKLSLSRAKGRSNQIDKRKNEVSSTLRILDSMELLTPKLLKKLSLFYCELTNESMKFYFRIMFLENKMLKAAYESGVSDRINNPITGISWFRRNFSCGNYNYKGEIKVLNKEIHNNTDKKIGPSLYSFLDNSPTLIVSKEQYEKYNNIEQIRELMSEPIPIFNFSPNSYKLFEDYVSELYKELNINNNNNK